MLLFFVEVSFPAMGLSKFLFSSLYFTCGCFRVHGLRVNEHMVMFLLVLFIICCTNKISQMFLDYGG